MKFKVEGQNISCIDKNLIVAGTVGIYKAYFSFSDDWNSLTSGKVAVFRSAGKELGIILGVEASGEYSCEIPNEIISTLKSGFNLFVSVVTSKTSEANSKKLEYNYPTVWCNAGTIQFSPTTIEASEPTTSEASIIQQLLSSFATNDAGEKIYSIWKPTLDSDGNLSWTLETNTSAPISKNIKGKKGDTGNTGPQGEEGEIWVPSVSEIGMISWEKKKASESPEVITGLSIKGPQGDKGDPGSDATITIDEEVTSDSDNPVKSKGIKKYIDGIFTNYLDDIDALLGNTEELT